ncbi:PorP/SprF family type IX secretion system membrane protein [Flammeovirgaceae bacterium SG7u.111]|nr:PorP/SprF family type IX secretion system membrane protein [Flammeovirgaceae bacterium SG7u.132]WPO36755.1 PorP/SprF family type IX secretion system membrane protein [Flammeovirgaceae bacterium SG7u.111]
MSLYKQIALLLATFTLFQISSFAQDISGNTLYMQNRYGINPAFAGSENGVFGALQSRSQFSGLSDAPRTYMFNVHAPIKNNIGLGGGFTSDSRGAFDYTSGELAASYRVGISSRDILQFGLSTGYIKNSLRASSIATNQYVDSSDPTLETGFFNETSFRFRTGVWYQHEAFDISVSFPELLVEGQKFHEHIIAMASYKFEFNGDWQLMPSVIYQSLPYGSDQADVNLKLEWKNLIWLQGGYRSNKSGLFSAGIKYNSINIGYAYEMASQELSNISNGSHEILLAINIPVKRKKKELTQAEREQEQRMLDEITLKEKKLKEREGQIREMEEEITLLRKQLGQEVEGVEIVDIDTASIGDKDSYILSIDAEGNEIRETIKPGNYIVINTCTNSEFAHHLIKIYKKKNIDASIAYNSKKKFYYIYTRRIKDFDEAVTTMHKHREAGFKNSWVLVYK